MREKNREKNDVKITTNTEKEEKESSHIEKVEKEKQIHAKRRYTKTRYS